MILSCSLLVTAFDQKQFWYVYVPILAFVHIVSAIDAWSYLNRKSIEYTCTEKQLDFIEALEAERIGGQDLVESFLENNRIKHIDDLSITQASCLIELLLSQEKIKRKKSKR